ncbi:MAG: ester cyclase [Vicinamibacterales bacterium]
MDHAATMRRLYDCVSAHDIAGFSAVLADDFIDHEELPGFAQTKDGAAAFFRTFIAAFPDMRMVPEDIIASGDKVVARVRVTGTHEGPFMGLSPTGKRVNVQAVDIIRFGQDGLAREHWGIFDQLGMMQQIGAIQSEPTV